MTAGCKKIERSEAVTAQIEAAQIEGRKATRLIFGSDKIPTDSLQLRQLVDSVRMRNKYHRDTIYTPEEVAAFDSAYISTIRALSPEVARRLHLYPQAK